MSFKKIVKDIAKSGIIGVIPAGGIPTSLHEGLAAQHGMLSKYLSDEHDRHEHRLDHERAMHEMHGRKHH